MVTTKSAGPVRTRVHDAYLGDYVTCRNVLPLAMAAARGRDFGVRCNTVTPLTDFPQSCSYCKARIC